MRIRVRAARRAGAGALIALLVMMAGAAWPSRAAAQGGPVGSPMPGSPPTVGPVAGTAQQRARSFAHSPDPHSGGALESGSRPGSSGSSLAGLAAYGTGGAPGVPSGAAAGPAPSAAALPSLTPPTPLPVRACCTTVLPIDLATASQLASNRNPAVRAARQSVVTAAQVVDQARGAKRGSADLNASYFHLNRPITLNGTTLGEDGLELVIPGSQIADENVLFANLQGRYPLYTGGRLDYNVERACLSVKENEDIACDAQLTIVSQAVRSYLAALFGKENVRANEASLQSYQAHLAEARAMRRQGTATDYDVTSAEAAVTDQENRLAQARKRYSLAVENLQDALALDKCTCLNVQGCFFNVAPECSMCDAEDKALQVDPLMRSYADRAGALGAAEKSILAERRPQIDAVLFANLLPRSSGFLTNAQWFVGLQLTQNLYNGGVIGAPRASKSRRAYGPAFSVRAGPSNVSLGLRSAYLELDTARSGIAAGAKSVELGRETLRLATRRYQEGVGTNLEVLDANISLLTAETSLARSRYELDAAYLDVHRYLGDLLQVAQCAQTKAGAQ